MMLFGFFLSVFCDQILKIHRHEQLYNLLNVLGQTINIQRAHMVSVTAKIFVGHDDLSLE
jgi:hypothetical protein